MSDTLDDRIHSEVTRLSEQGNAASEAGDYEKSLALFRQALKLLPKPIQRWDAGGWLMTAIGDTHFLKGDYAAAASALKEALEFPKTLGNPFVHLRLGESVYELGESARAADELTRAYMGGGEELFDGEDPKYFRFLKTKIRTELPKSKR
ncbi:MAG: tetratricopeptide repeat protein [Acidobacteria bacterium]|nr:tetratricopeptide repeat protein [Acidobacteriota bacterium]